MLSKFVSDTSKDWDKWLPFLLCTYWEVPQAYTGFSPFKLVYGWSVQRSVKEKLGGTDSISRGRMRHCPISTTDERPSKGIQRTGPGES